MSLDERGKKKPAPPPRRPDPASLASARDAPARAAHLRSRLYGSAPKGSSVGGGGDPSPSLVPSLALGSVLLGSGPIATLSARASVQQLHSPRRGDLLAPSLPSMMSFAPGGAVSIQQSVVAPMPSVLSARHHRSSLSPPRGRAVDGGAAAGLGSSPRVPPVHPEVSTAAVAAGAKRGSARRGGGPRLIDALGISRDAITGTNFIYLTSPSGSCYDLRLVKAGTTRHGLHGSTYYTLSETGFTSFSGADIEFTPLAQFEREYEHFHVLSARPFFREFARRRILVMWRRAIRQSRFKLTAAALSARLFVSHPVLYSVLKEMHEAAYETSLLRLYLVDTAVTSSLDEFCARQALQRAEVLATTAAFHERSLAVVKSACESSLRAFLERSGFTEGMVAAVAASALEQEGPAAPQSGVAAGPSIAASTATGGGGGGGAPKWTAAATTPRAITFTERATMRTHCRSLTRFIRRIDMLVRDTSLDIIVSSTQALAGTMRQPKARSPVAADASPSPRGRGAVPPPALTMEQRRMMQNTVIKPAFTADLSATLVATAVRCLCVRAAAAARC
jgi:hypothetical protein